MIPRLCPRGLSKGLHLEHGRKLGIAVELAFVNRDRAPIGNHHCSGYVALPQRRVFFRAFIPRSFANHFFSPNNRNRRAVL